MERRRTGGAVEKHTTESDVRSSLAVASVVLGGVGVAIGFFPRFFVFAWLLGVAAIATGVPGSRQDPEVPSRRIGRAGVAAGVVAIVLGLIGLGIELNWFDYFNPDDTFRR